MEKDKTVVCYFHGFASGPQSEKAKYFKRRFSLYPVEFYAPDLNVPSFERLHFEEVVDFAMDFVSKLPSEKIFLIGSSLGAIIALMVAQENLRVKRLVLLAPAADFHKRLPDIVGPENMKKWEKEGQLPIYHHQLQKEIPLHYGFIESLAILNKYSFTAKQPTIVFHGAFDEVIPFEAAERFTKNLINAEFHLLETDHNMLNKLDWMWKDIAKFLGLEPANSETK